MSKRIRVVIVVIVVLAIGTIGYLVRRDSDDDGLTLYGNVDIREVDLGFRVSGRLVEMRLEEGDAVKPGNVIARLDPAPYQDELAAAEARVNRAKANVERLRSGSRPQEIESARARVREARAAYQNARRDLERQRELAAVDAASQKVLDQAQARRDETAAQLASARESLALAEEGFRTEDIAAGEAELAEAIAQRDLAQTRLEDSELFAPSNGVILTRIREPGTILREGEPVYTLSLQETVYVRAYVSGPDLGRIAPGNTVWVVTDSSDKRYRGQIGFISPRAEFTPKSVETPDLRTDLVYRLRIVVQDPDEGLRQGMPVTVDLPFAAGTG